MTATINASTSAGVIVTSDTSGSLAIQSNGTTVFTAGPTGVSFTNASTAAPAFSAYQSSAQTLSSGTWTKIIFQTEEFDTNNNFDSTTNYRFTPTVAGYYQVNGAVCIGSTNTGGAISIYKNGGNFKQGFSSASTATVIQGWIASALIYFNGSTDYVELYQYITVGQALSATAQVTYFQASLVRSA